MELTDDLIDGYLQGKLTEQDRRTFEARLMQDRQWASYVSEYTELTQQIERYGWGHFESTLFSAEQKLEQAGFFITEEDLDDYLSGNIEQGQTELIERLRFGNADFSQRIEALMDIRRAVLHAGYSQSEQFLEQAEQNMDAKGFFEEIHQPIFEKMPKPLPPVVKALIAVGVVLVLILLLRFLL